MLPLCHRCERPLTDVSDQHLPAVRDTVRWQLADAVYFCGDRCVNAYLLIEGDFVPVRRRWVMERDG